MPICLVVQHLEPEGPYKIAEELEGRGIDIEMCRVFAGDPVPIDMTGFDALVVMGGSMSAASDDGFPTRRAEIALLVDAVGRQAPVLGVCLGAQLLAASLGAKVYKGSSGPEIGWMPVTLTADSKADPLFANVGSGVTVMHWHGDTFDLPAGSKLLASSERYENQAFRFGESCWGLQFHLEVDRQGVDSFITSFGDEAHSIGVTNEMLERPAEEALESLAPFRGIVLGRFAEMIRERAVNCGDRSCL
ncbi:MAG: type 1 glutamine amidotransferase [Acidimicrobiales bacterium]